MGDEDGAYGNWARTEFFSGDFNGSPGPRTSADISEPSMSEPSN